MSGITRSVSNNQSAMCPKRDRPTRVEVRAVLLNFSLRSFSCQNPEVIFLLSRLTFKSGLQYSET